MDTMTEAPHSDAASETSARIDSPDVCTGMYLRVEDRGMFDSVAEAWECDSTGSGNRRLSDSPADSAAHFAIGKRELVTMEADDCGAALDLGNTGSSADALSDLGSVLSGPVRIATALLEVADSPRLAGEDTEHVARLAELDTELPPIIVHHRTMRVIDGVHRLRAAELRGDLDIEVSFFEGSESDAFAVAVKENVSHGLPLSTADRIAAAKRLLETHPDWSDRALAAFTGLAAKTISTIRRCSATSVPELTSRIGRDGKVRPLDSETGRRLASQLIKERPDASLREIARAAGISPATVRDVRARLNRGEDPVPGKVKRAERPAAVSIAHGRTPDELLRMLQKDPSLRLTDSGRALLRLLSSLPKEAQAWEQLGSSVPPHCAGIVARIAREYASGWHDFANALADLHHTTVA
ncbi:ParB N-terminal domain-containing protein [Nocardia sp. NPDC051463]|uniref:ParB/RepB/Spo0J family partition protein n=1 Tax=Nocardia sp. NPDC051463 TaxID=3154845 RepID=UPI003424F966